MLLDSPVHEVELVLARLKTSVWKGQSFKITARSRVICERSLDVPIAVAFCKLFTIGLKCAARSSVPTKSVRVEGREEGIPPSPDSRVAILRESNFYIKAAAIIFVLPLHHKKILSIQSDDIRLSALYLRYVPKFSSFNNI